ncbi:MAG TPA: SurA N-terminal domain-containing protein [Nocardioidaceae bacterium]|nr:SurA N-terminal domain-containing protein [Nocardioidaceae bacterium]
MTRSRTRGALAAAAATMVLSGCGGHPGDAAVIGSESIRTAQVDEVALALCSAQSVGGEAPAQDVPARTARQGALGVLVSSALSLQYGQATGVEVDAAQVSAAVAANRASIDQLPASRREAFEDTLRTFAEGQLTLIAAGRARLLQRGTRNPTEQQSLTEGTRLRDAWARTNDVDVTVDPRYGRFSAGALRPQSGSLSVPVSSPAAAGAEEQPASEWVTALPASQKCR